MDRKAGYLANILNIPPLLFRFQFNPTSVSEKKSFRYEQQSSFGSLGFDQTAAGSGFIGKLSGLWEDVKEISSTLVRTRPLEARDGEPRVLQVEFQLDARIPGPLDGSGHYGTPPDGSIEFDLATLRAFMRPSWDLVDIGKMIVQKRFICPEKPPELDFLYGGLSMKCVMTDLNIRIVEFKDDRTPLRAEVSVTLKEQTASLSPIVEMGKATFYQIPRSLGREGIGKDFLANTPIVGLFF